MDILIVLLDDRKMLKLFTIKYIDQNGKRIDFCTESDTLNKETVLQYFIAEED